MQYQGGKAKIGRQIAAVIEPALYLGSGHYVEPFMGMCGVARHIAPHAESMSLGDASEDLVLLWRAMRDGWLPPAIVTEAEYGALRNAAPSAERAFAGYGCSFAAKWFRGYARNAAGTDYAGQARRAMVEKWADLNRCPLDFYHRDYAETPVHWGQVVYCDPPYAGTEGYRRDLGKFDHDAFWSTALGWADEAGAFVFVSEFAAPEGWVPVWAKPRDRSMSGKNQHTAAPARRAAGETDQLFCRPALARMLVLEAAA